MSSDAAIPGIISAAGEEAVRAYREFLGAIRSRRTLQLNRGRIRGFCCWAEARALPLELIEPSDVLTYSQLFSAESGVRIVWVMRRLFDHLADAGVLAENPWAPASVTRRRARFVWELQALRRELMAELNERHADDPTLDLVKSIDHKLASMTPTANEPTGRTQESADAR